ncbi:hypothetical protein Y032_0053g2315 [Ancylostoma ceylanicum]|uniref:Uncharacterized protein n=1 Tax=Ancylostoma ceylanicum TaxID=53326 RepID=A0A016U6M0_9BILA|nr:hypothetical protein Y032_0053g2315 [Ancylostoma ceylanicum]
MVSAQFIVFSRLLKRLTQPVSNVYRAFRCYSFEAALLYNRTRSRDCDGRPNGRTNDQSLGPTVVVCERNSSSSQQPVSQPPATTPAAAAAVQQSLYTALA